MSECNACYVNSTNPQWVALLIPEHEWHDRGLRLPTNPYRSQK